LRLFTDSIHGVWRLSIGPDNTSAMDYFELQSQARESERVTSHQ
jgi:hypothetical protein